MSDMTEENVCHCWSNSRYYLYSGNDDSLSQPRPPPPQPPGLGAVWSGHWPLTVLSGSVPGDLEGLDEVRMVREGTLKNLMWALMTSSDMDHGMHPVPSGTWLECACFGKSIGHMFIAHHPIDGHTIEIVGRSLEILDENTGRDPGAGTSAAEGCLAMERLIR